MKWFSLMVAGVALLYVCRVWQRLMRRGVSREWLAEDDRRRAALGYEGVCYDGPFNDRARRR